MKQIFFDALPVLLVTGLAPLVVLLWGPETETTSGDMLWPADPPGSSALFTESAENGEAQEPAAHPTQTEDALLIWDEGSGLLRTETVRDYLIGAVASEMPVTWPDEALKAQIVACHSWALYCRDHRSGANSGAYFSACPQRRQGYMTDEVLKAYWGDAYEENKRRIGSLVDAVLTDILVWSDAPAGAFYHAVSAGHTASSGTVWGESLPYLCGVDSAWDCLAEGYESELTLTAQQVYGCLLSSLGITTQDSPGGWLGEAEYDAAGYCTSIEIQGHTVSGYAFRNALGLRSAAFTYVYDKSCGEFTFTTYGYGHGVGLSQWGAKTMAEQGSGWQEILAHYFPGTDPGCSLDYPA